MQEGEVGKGDAEKDIRWRGGKYRGEGSGVEEREVEGKG